MTPHASRAHATKAPSSAHRFMNCAASLRMGAGVADSGSIFAAEGTAAHELAEKCIRGHFDAERFKGDTIIVNKTPFLVNDDMVTAVQVYLDEVYAIEQESDEFESEIRMDMQGLVPGVFGTGDVIAYSEAQQRVTICDYKHGRGIAVDVEDNKQLLTYAMGVADRYHNRGIKEVKLIVVQPRAPHPKGPVRRWTTDVITLYEHVAALQAVVDDANSTFKTGDHCVFCRGEGFCGPLQDKVYEIIGAKLEKGVLVGMEQPEARPFKDWETEQSELNMVARWAKRREAFAHEEAIRGNLPPGAKLVAKRAFRKFPDVEIAGKALVAAGADIDDIYEPPALKSPAAIEKVVGKLGKEVVKQLAKAESSGTVLAPWSDARPAVDLSDSRGFEAVEIEERA